MTNCTRLLHGGKHCSDDPLEARYERFRDWPVDGIHRLETDVGFDPDQGWYGP